MTRKIHAVGSTVVPRGGTAPRWKKPIASLGESGESGWYDLADYAETVAYQTAGALNSMIRGLPPLPDGMYWEFGARQEVGRSVLVARRVLAESVDESWKRLTGERLAELRT